MHDLYVGIDVSKDFSSAHGLDKTGKSCFSVSIPTVSTNLYVIKTRVS